MFPISASMLKNPVMRLRGLSRRLWICPTGRSTSLFASGCKTTVGSPDGNAQATSAFCRMKRNCSHGTGRSILIWKQVNPNQRSIFLFVNMPVFASTNFPTAKTLAQATHSKETSPIFHIFPALLTQEHLYYILKSRIG